MLARRYPQRDGGTGEGLWHQYEGAGTGPVHSELVMERSRLSSMMCDPGLPSISGSSGGRRGDVLPVPRQRMAWQGAAKPLWHCAALLYQPRRHPLLAGWINKCFQKRDLAT